MSYIYAAIMLTFANRDSSDICHNFATNLRHMADFKLLKSVETQKIEVHLNSSLVVE